jgi:hypothetical protein
MSSHRAGGKLAPCTLHCTSKLLDPDMERELERPADFPLTPVPPSSKPSRRAIRTSHPRRLRRRTRRLLIHPSSPWTDRAHDDAGRPPRLQRWPAIEVSGGTEASVSRSRSVSGSSRSSAKTMPTVAGSSSPRSSRRTRTAPARSGRSARARRHHARPARPGDPASARSRSCSPCQVTKEAAPTSCRRARSTRA